MSNTPEEAVSASTSSFVTSLVVNSIIAGAEVVGFIILRRWIKAIYEPRTYIPPKEEQAAVLPPGILWPIWKIIFADPEEILKKNGVDPYVYVRFLMMMTKAMTPIFILSWIIIIPVDSVNTGTGKQGLDRFTFGNVADTDQSRLWTHLILDIIFVAWFIFLIAQEMDHWLTIRQRHLISPGHSRLPQASTILVTGIPPSYMDEERLASLYAPLPGGIKQIWLNRNLKEMPDLWERRATAALKLEAAEVKLMKLARKLHAENQAKMEKLTKKGKPIPDSLQGPANPQLLETSTDETRAEEATALDLVDQLVPRSKRPQLRLKPKWAPFGLGFLGIGQKVDTVEWCRSQIQDIEPRLAKSRAQLEDDVKSPGTQEDFYPPRNSAFIRFNQQIAAHMAAEALAHHIPYSMSKRYLEQNPDDVIWGSLGLNPYEQKVRQAISYALTGGLIIAWSFPVAFIGILSNVTTLTDKAHWLSWIKGDSFGKHLLQGVISGVLPPVLLALLMMLLPVVLRRLAIFEGKPSRTEVELDLCNRFFVFLVVHTFFIVTLASGLVSAIPQLISDPVSIPNILANQLPTASTFFLTLILTQLTGLGGSLLQIVSLLLYYVKVILLGGSPRSVFKTRYRLRTPDWGTDFPQVTVYAVIMLAYCVISPIINGFAAAFFAIAAVVYKYLFIYVLDQPASSDSGGAFFPKAIGHVFVGLYVQEICLCALFFLSRDENSGATAIPQAVIMIVVIVVTAGVHYVIMTSYSPLRQSLPLSLAHLSYGMPRAQRDRGESMIGESDDEDDEVHRIEMEKTFRRPVEDTGKIEKLITERGNTLEKVRETLEKKAPSGEASPNQRSNSYTARENGKLPSPPRSAPPSSFPNYPLPGTSSPEEMSPRISEQSSSRGFATAPGPPLGSTHAFHEGPDGFPTDNGNDMELGTLGQTPDPNMEEADNQPVTYLVQPGGPGIREKRDINADDPTAFFHPCTKEELRILWLPADQLGLCKAEVQACEKVGIKATSRNAILTNKGNVRIYGAPPDDF